MTKKTKPVASPSDAFADLSFEAALTQLEQTVEAMEDEELELEKLLKLYEQGMRLRNVCQTKLQAARLKIEKLEKDAEGQPALKPLTLNDLSE